MKPIEHRRVALHAGSVRIHRVQGGSAGAAAPHCVQDRQKQPGGTEGAAGRSCAHGVTEAGEELQAQLGTNSALTAPLSSKHKGMEWCEGLDSEPSRRALERLCSVLRAQKCDASPVSLRPR